MIPFAFARYHTLMLLLAALLASLVPVARVVADPDPAAPLLALVASSEQKAQRLAAKLEACRVAGQDIAYPDASLAVAQYFCRASRSDAGKADLIPSALAGMKYVDAMLDGELHRADEALAGRVRYPVIPQWRTVGVTWHDGGFWSGNEPVFLSGFNWDAGVVDNDPALFKRLGVNLSDGMMRGTMNADGSFDDAGMKAGDGALLDRVGQAGFAADCLFGFGPPKWLTDANPGLVIPGYGNGFDAVFEAPQIAQFLDKILDHFVPLYAAHPALFAVDLANEPAFQEPSDLMFVGWRVWLQRKYGTLEALNRAWGTNFDSFEAIRHYPSQPELLRGIWWERGPVDFSKPGIRGMHYDWCAFNNDRVGGFFRSLSDRIHAKAPRVATHVKVMMGSEFTGSTEPRGWEMNLSYHTFGLDPEILAGFCSLLGGDMGIDDLGSVEKPNRNFGSVPYICGWIDAGLSADYLKSLAPDKAFYDSEFHIIADNQPLPDATGAKEHMELALWLAHLHGMSANLTWYWGRDTNASTMSWGAEWFKGSLLQQPWALQAYAQESLSLRRFVRPVMAFARQPRRVRLLYSEPSAIQDVHYLDTLRDAYEALNFLGVPIGVVTERQLATGGVPADTRVVIVPNARYVQDQTVAALKTARRKGLTIGIIDDASLSMLPTGGHRADAQVPGAERLAPATPQVYQPQFDAWMRAAGVQRELTALDAEGRPAWGIETRTAHEGGRRLAYLANLMRQPVTVTLHWNVADAKLRDWRTDTAVANQVTLQPRQVIFGAY